MTYLHRLISVIGASRLLAVALLVGLAPFASAQSLAPRPAVVAPAELSPYGSAWQAKGSGVLRFFGIKAYDATLWLPGAEAAFSFAKPFALDFVPGLLSAACAKCA